MKMTDCLQLVVLVIGLISTPLFARGADGTLKLLEELREEPLSKDATKDIPPKVDESQLKCLSEASGKSSNDPQQSAPPTSSQGVR